MGKKIKTQRSTEQAITPAPITDSATVTETRVMDTLIGLTNRKNHSITVMLKKDSFVLSPSARTGKDYKESDVVSINGLTLKAAVSAGTCSIIR